MSFSDESELSELSSEEEYQVTKGKGKKKAKKSDPEKSLIRGALKAPRATTYSAQALYDAIISVDINLDAEYQRDVVWQDSKQVELIDSIYRNFYVPPVIFATQSHDDGSETKICIDGKQRLTSLRRFMDGLIPFKDPNTNERWWYKDSIASTSRKKTKKLLPEGLRKLFANKQIVCVEYHDINDADEREIFTRVQLGMALTPAEKLQVIKSPRSEFVRELVVRYVSEGALSPGAGNVAWDSSRGSDFRCMCAAIMMLQTWGTIKTWPSVTGLEKWLDVQDDLPDALYTLGTEAFTIFETIASDEKLRKVFKLSFPGTGAKEVAKVAPMEFIFTAILIGVLKDKLSMKALSVAIGDMRMDIRRRHVDVRMNSRVGGDMMQFISKYKIPPRAKGEMTAAEEIRKGGSSSAKRKRAAQSSDEASDDDAMDESEPEKQPPPPSTTTTTKPVSKKQRASSVVKKEPDDGTLSAPPSAPRLPSSATQSTSRLAGIRASRGNTTASIPPSASAPPQSLPGSSTSNLNNPNAHLPTPPISTNAIDPAVANSWSHQQGLLQTQGLGVATGSWQSKQGAGGAGGSGPMAVSPTMSNHSGPLSARSDRGPDWGRDRDRDRDRERDRDRDRDWDRERDRDRDRDGNVYREGKHYRDRSREDTGRGYRDWDDAGAPGGPGNGRRKSWGRGQGHYR